jgi:hypothetical protein
VISASSPPLRVLNVMLGTGGGGLERSVASYHAALIAGGAEVVSVLAPGAWAQRLVEPGWRVLQAKTSRLGLLASRQLSASVAG